MQVGEITPVVAAAGQSLDVLVQLLLKSQTATIALENNIERVFSYITSTVLSFITLPKPLVWVSLQLLGKTRYLLKGR